MNIFKSYKNAPWHNNDYKDKRKMKQSIFGNGNDTIGKNNKQYNFLHSVIKYKILVPGMHLFRRMLKGYSLQIDDFWFRNLRVFRDSWDEASEIMSQKYNKCFSNHASYKLVKELVILICKFDTATLEFMNVFQHSLTKNMQNEYKGHKKVYHMIYANKLSYDPIYFNMGKYVLGKENMSPKDAHLYWMYKTHNKHLRSGIDKMIMENRSNKELVKSLRKYKKQIIDLKV